MTIPRNRGRKRERGVYNTIFVNAHSFFVLLNYVLILLCLILILLFYVRYIGRAALSTDVNITGEKCRVSRDATAVEKCVLEVTKKLLQAAGPDVPRCVFNKMCNIIFLLFDKLYLLRRMLRRH